MLAIERRTRSCGVTPTMVARYVVRWRLNTASSASSSSTTIDEDIPWAMATNGSSKSAIKNRMPSGILGVWRLPWTRVWVGWISMFGPIIAMFQSAVGVWQ